MSNRIAITDNLALVQYLRDIRLLAADDKVEPEATLANVAHRIVIAPREILEALPLKIAAAAKALIEVRDRLPPELRGEHLHLDQGALYLETFEKYTVIREGITAEDYDFGDIPWIRLDSRACPECHGTREIESTNIYGDPDTRECWDCTPSYGRGTGVWCLDFREVTGDQLKRAEEVAVRRNLPYLTKYTWDNGKTQVICHGDLHTIRAFLKYWAPSKGLEDIDGSENEGTAIAFLLKGDQKH